MKPSRCLPMLPLLASLAACGTSASGLDKSPARIVALPRDLTANEQDIIAASNDFGFRLLHEVNAGSPDSNVFLSPLSASMALGMALDGAESTTYTEMRSALGLGTHTYDEINRSYQSLIGLLRGLDGRVDFRIANAIFFDATFGPAIEPAYLTDAATWFDAKASPLDFMAPASVDTINQWVNQATNGRITSLLQQIDPQLVMLLLNAIYFKGDWRDQFDPAETQDRPFADVDGAISNIATMHRKGGFRLGYAPSATLIELPYGGDAFEMTILLPDSGQSVNAMIASLTTQAWEDAVATLADARSEQELFLPKFRLEWEDTLNGALEQLGMVRAFEPNGADFTRISATMGDKLYISFVKQKTYVDVNEEGTEAAAVTGIGIGLTSLPAPVRVDRPFLFALRERLSGTVLFLGKFVRPPAS